MPPFVIIPSHASASTRRAGDKTKMPHLRAASAIFIASGGDKEIRTLDPLLAKQVLYQLSYTPFQ